MSWFSIKSVGYISLRWLTIFKTWFDLHVGLLIQNLHLLPRIFIILVYARHKVPLEVVVIQHVKYHAHSLIVPNRHRAYVQHHEVHFFIQILHLLMKNAILTAIFIYNFLHLLQLDFVFVLVAELHANAECWQVHVVNSSLELFCFIFSMSNDWCANLFDVIIFNLNLKFFAKTSLHHAREILLLNCKSGHRFWCLVQKFAYFIV